MDELIAGHDGNLDSAVQRCRSLYDKDRTMAKEWWTGKSKTHLQKTGFHLLQPSMYRKSQQICFDFSTVI